MLSTANVHPGLKLIFSAGSTPDMLNSVSNLKFSVILLLMLSLCIRSVVPQGLMIARNGHGPFDFSIVLCDGSKGLGSVPAFQNLAGLASSEHGADHNAHHNTPHNTPHNTDKHHDTGHNGHKGGCPDCDLTWGSSLFDDFTLDFSELKFDYCASRVFISSTDNDVFTHRFYSYDSRAPPIILVA